MAMTYAALAKSLGLSLGRSAPSQAAPSESSASASESTSAPAPSIPPVANSEGLAEEPERQPQSPLGKRKSEETEELPSPAKKSKIDLEEAEQVLREEAGPSSDTDAEGETDIASSRPPSPCNASVASPTPAQEPEPPEPASTEVEMTDSQPALEEPSPQEEPESLTCDDKPAPVPPANGEQPMSLDVVPTINKTPRLLTDEQLHHAKVLVLDLLGWGVTPEYLLQRGVSHALLYTVFTDLRLRLPEKIKADCIALVAAAT